MSTNRMPSRRQFNAIGASLFGAAAMAPAVASADEPAAPAWPNGRRILFQGDSITDAGRQRDANAVKSLSDELGNGYAWLAGSQLLVDYPDAGIALLNRAVSGSTLQGMAERWQADCIDLKPDFVSVLIGVNDASRALETNTIEQSLERFETDYHALLALTKQSLPGVKLIVCEPFVLRCGVINDKWFPMFGQFRQAVRTVAARADAVLVPLQEMMDRAVALAPPERWAADGVHATMDGASLMAHVWRSAIDASM
ncbi:SGNH/GDSL hydrolase family protein [Lacipirellula sp.]|uniref:SGNH/GDSL hydrolase family protein n=1 Tax=Lacipirellula sp. TaxID=2691419 RepID=UPI003D13E592